MADVIGSQLRREVQARARWRCEYCLMPEEMLVWGCEVDHIISQSTAAPANYQTSRFRALGVIARKGKTWDRFTLRAKDWCAYTIHAAIGGMCISSSTALGLSGQRSQAK